MLLARSPPHSCCSGPPMGMAATLPCPGPLAFIRRSSDFLIGPLAPTLLASCWALCALSSEGAVRMPSVMQCVGHWSFYVFWSFYVGDSNIPQAFFLIPQAFASAWKACYTCHDRLPCHKAQTFLQPSLAVYLSPDSPAGPAISVTALSFFRLITHFPCLNLSAWPTVTTDDLLRDSARVTHSL